MPQKGVLGCSSFQPVGWMGPGVSRAPSPVTCACGPPSQLTQCADDILWFSMCKKGWEVLLQRNDRVTWKWNYSVVGYKNVLFQCNSKLFPKCSCQHCVRATLQPHQHLLSSRSSVWWGEGMSHCGCPVDFLNTNEAEHLFMIIDHLYFVFWNTGFFCLI